MYLITERLTEALNGKICAIYARVSTDMQGESLQNQVEYAKEYVRRLGEGYEFDETFIYEDFDKSGYYTRFIDRSAIQKALKDAKERKYDVIIFKEISRISRDQVEHLEIITRFTQEGIRVIAINDNVDSDRPETLDLISIKSVFSEMESRGISTRVSAGNKAKARRGLWPGEAPIGYRVNPETKKLEIDDKYADIPRIIFDLYARKGFGTFRIAETLNEQGLLTKNRRLWSRVTVNRVLKNPAYIGNLVYGKTRNALQRSFYDDGGYNKKKGINNISEKEWIVMQGTHPALVDVETFETAQIIMSRRAKQKPRRVQHPLSGILRCGRCGTGMVCQKRTYKDIDYRYYICATAFKYGRKMCDQPNIRAEVLEQTVLDVLLQKLNVYRTVPTIVTMKSSERDIQRDIRRLEKERNKHESALSRLFLNGDSFDSDSFERLKTNFASDIKRLTEKIEELRIRVEDNKQKEEFTAKIEDYFHELRNMDLTDLNRARHLFHSLVNELKINGKSLEELRLNYNL